MPKARWRMETVSRKKAKKGSAMVPPAARPPIDREKRQPKMKPKVAR